MDPTPDTRSPAPEPAPAIPTHPIINEFVLDHNSVVDVAEFVEIFATPSTDYSSLAVIALRGEKAPKEENEYTYGPGSVEAIVRVGRTNSQGYWAEFQSNTFPGKGTQTLLLVRDLAANAVIGIDLDREDDGELDPEVPFAEILDAVAVLNKPGDPTYAGIAILSGDLDGDPHRFHGASRIPNGTDTDSPADWKRNDFWGDGLGFQSVPPADEKHAVNTPNLPNRMGVAISPAK
jgi:hypothetical protein